MVAMTSGAALYVAGLAGSLKEGVDMSLLFQIHKTCLHLKQDHNNSVSLVGV